MKTSFCIIGSGIAGMALAIRLSQLGEVILVSKSSLISGSTPFAQGGLAAVVQQPTDVRKFSDSFQSHFEDTMHAGRQANTPESVRILVENAPEVFFDLEKWGVHFHEDRHLEGGHSHHRIFNTGDSTGLSIAQGLAKKIKKISNITVLENTLLTKISGKNTAFYDFKKKKNFWISAQKIFLATGGYSSLFRYATSPSGNIGDGISVFLQAGGAVRHLRRVQFHPTVLDLPRDQKFLISEAVRGAGAKIVFEDGSELCDPLLPRDVVSRNIYNAIKSGKKIFLDARNIDDFSAHFESIHSVLQNEFDIDATKDLIPIRPAAHYCMGGIATDIYGRTNLPDIFALGECAESGVHGKNRLASNSLLEGLVFAKQIADFIIQNPGKIFGKNSEKNEEKNPENFVPSSAESSSLGITIQSICSKYMGMNRTEQGIATGKKLLSEISEKQLGTREKNMKILAEKMFADCTE